MKLTVLTEEEFLILFTSCSDEEEKAGKPTFFDDNSDAWIRWLHKNNYRLIKVEDDDGGA